MSAKEELAKKDQQLLHQLIAAVDENPYDAHRYYDLGSLLVRLQNYPQAEELFLKALNIFMDDAGAQSLLHYGLGNVYYAAGMYEKAIPEFMAVKDHKLQADALLMTAQGYYAQGQYQQAMVFALTASEKAADQSSALSLLADCFLASGDFEQAKKYYEQVLKLLPSDVHANFQRGLIAEVQGQSSANYFAKVKQQDPKYLTEHQERLNEIAALIKSKQGQQAKE